MKFTAHNMYSLIIFAILWCICILYFNNFEDSYGHFSKKGHFFGTRCSYCVHLFICHVVIKILLLKDPKLLYSCIIKRSTLTTNLCPVVLSRWCFNNWDYEDNWAKNDTLSRGAAVDRAGNVTLLITLSWSFAAFLPCLVLLHYTV